MHGSGNAWTTAAAIAEKARKSILLERVVKYLRKWKDWKYFDPSLLVLVAGILVLLFFFSVTSSRQ